MTVVAATRRGSISSGKADARVCTAFASPIGLGFSGKEIVACDLCTLFNEIIRSSKVLVNDVAHDSPTVRIASSLSLMLKIFQDHLAVLLNASNITEESVSLRIEDCLCQLPGGCRTCSGWVESVEHGDAVSFREGLQAHFVYQRL